MYGLKKNESTLPRSLEAAQHFRVVVTRVDVIQIFLKQKEFDNVVEVTSPDRYLTMLDRDRVDHMPYNKIMFEQYVKRKGFKTEDFVSLFELDEISTSLYMALSKHSSQGMKTKLETAYQKVKTDGIYKEIMDRFHAYRKGLAPYPAVKIMGRSKVPDTKDAVLTWKCCSQIRAQHSWTNDNRQDR